jgi:hypothetical protein
MKKFDKLYENVFKPASDDEANERYWSKLKEKNIPNDLLEKIKNDNFIFDLDSLKYEVSKDFPEISKISDINGEIILLNNEMFFTADQSFGGFYYDFPIFDYTEADKNVIHQLINTQF